jgi:hypothetical protein
LRLAASSPPLSLIAGATARTPAAIGSATTWNSVASPCALALALHSFPGTEWDIPYCTGTGVDPNDPVTSRLGFRLSSSGRGDSSHHAKLLHARFGARLVAIFDSASAVPTSVHGTGYARGLRIARS